MERHVVALHSSVLVLLERREHMLSRGVIMEHNPFASFDDGLEITYSDLKKRDDGTAYVSIYFEAPNTSKKEFNSARFDYPGTSFSDVKGYSADALKSLRQHVDKGGKLMLGFSMEDAALA
jgi:hypothetical protein